jgi:hypothetical protein
VFKTAEGSVCGGGGFGAVNISMWCDKRNGDILCCSTLNSVDGAMLYPDANGTFLGLPRFLMAVLEPFED